MYHTIMGLGVEIRGHYMPSQGENCLELFHVFKKLHTIGGSEDKQDRPLMCIVYYWVPHDQPNYRYKKYFKGSLRP